MSSLKQSAREILDKIWDDGYSVHKLTQVQGNRVDEREFRQKCNAQALTALTQLVKGLVQGNPLPDYKQEYIDKLIPEQSFHYFRGREFERAEILTAIKGDTDER